MVFYTLNQVINLIETIALNHAQVNSFGFGDVSDISTVQEDYPLVWLNVQPSTINENTFTLSLSLLTLDIQKADQANERDTLSDTLSIAQDIYSALTNPEYEDYFIIQYSTSLTPVREGLPDLVNGWGAELLLDIAQIRDRCQIPTKGFIGVSPSNSIAPTISPSGVQPVGTLFTASVGTWVGTLPITYEYRWTRNGTPINGATNSTYTSVNADEGSTIRCEVRATNDYGTSSYVASSNSSLCGAVPVNTVAPVISGNTTLGSTLTTTNGTWTGTATITFGYQWKRNGTNINGETNSTYVLTVADSAASITCEVTGTNSIGTGNATSNTITAGNYAPSNTVAPTLSPSGSQVTGTVITLGNGTWTGTSPITYEYRWLRDNVVISGETANTYTILAGDDGTVIKGQVRATNAAGVSSYVTTSNQVDAVNAVIDPDAQAFLTAAGITDPTITDAVNDLVVGCKADGLWAKFTGLYPFVGGTASSMKFNLKNPLDTNAAFRLSFNGGYTFQSTGLLPNGTNAYADTFISGDDFTNNDTHAAFYSRTEETNDSVDYGGADGVGNGIYMFTKRLFGNGGNISVQYDSDRNEAPAIAASTKLIVATRTSATFHGVYRDGTLIASKTSTNAYNITTMTTIIALSAFRNFDGGTPILHSSRELAFASFGAGLSPTDVTNLNNLVNAFQTALSRNV